ncbi:FKBP-type peptidyl-prolyl cis-trans isomerase [Phenylobacterium hankyongense]|uniref:Peptidyl-prolyl cis-trans isomerase n=1 Tax=Phenylobacterium hankyongense TaxID=1813876 RepID=A0A328AYB0_9CAUL|nr:FKBP-type peptidyl-prolyl cis-trans isomerase [Phenylobacterium hankyongense]RAK59639.1 FKBP-type peptidyl-prolyl cis-trans isomerase [Phenylobacterium hankyongense]
MFRTLTILACALALGACHKTLPDQSAAAKTFLAQNATQPGVHVLPDGLQYKVVRSGPADGLRPQRMDEVKVHYEGKLINGKVFDSSYERGQPASMPLKGLIPGWQEALQLMRPGDEWVLYVPPALGYGDQGAGGEIPPGAALIFRIELIDVLPGVGHIQQG